MQTMIKTSTSFAPRQFALLSGSPFSAEDMRGLQLGEMKSKMLLGSLTKLGKLRVQLDQGHIIGYCMQS